MTPADGTTLDSQVGCPSGLAPVESDQSQFTIDPAAYVKQKDGESSLDILVRGAKCGACLSKIENGVRNLESITDVRLNLTTGRLRTSWRDEDFDPGDILKLLNRLGYGATPYDPESADKQHSKREKQLLSAMAVAGFASANIMLLSVSVWAGVGEMSHMTRTAMHWISAAIAVPTVAYSGRHFFNSAYGALRSGHVNMDVPISLAVILAVCMSIYQTINHGEHAYFDAAVMLLFFLLIGRFLDARLQREAHSAARDLAAMQAVSVTRLTDQGAESVRASLVSPGDIIAVAAGERFPVDAEIIEGETELDTRMVTGETRLSQSGPGDRVYAGAVNVSRVVKAKVRNTAEDSMLSEISKLLEAGEQKRSSYRQLADKAAKLYVPLVHTLAASTLIGWMLVRGDVEYAVFTAIAVLIITCPCALALAAPVVQVVSVGKLFKQGVYLKSGDALERIAACDVVVFDKTGTLTQSAPSLVTGDVSDTALQQAALLARGSRHPLSRAIVFHVGGGPVAEDIEEFPGKGVSGQINGRQAWLGSAKWIADNTLSEDRAPSDASMVFAIEGEEPVPLFFEETPMPGAIEIIQELAARDIESVVLSGDSQPRVDKLSAVLGVQDAIGEVSPVDKSDFLEKLAEQGRKVLMIGDGLNDAGAIANAHASLTPGGAVDISRNASDGVYSGEDLTAIADIIDMARVSKTRMFENFGFAALYNCVAVPIAVLGFVTPLVAAIAMSGSSVVVTVNALRLNFLKPKRIAS